MDAAAAETAQAKEEMRAKRVGMTVAVERAWVLVPMKVGVMAVVRGAVVAVIGAEAEVLQAKAAPVRVVARAEALQAMAAVVRVVARAEALQARAAVVRVDARAQVLLAKAAAMLAVEWAREVALVKVGAGWWAELVVVVKGLRSNRKFLCSAAQSRMHHKRTRCLGQQ